MSTMSVLGVSGELALLAGDALLQRAQEPLGRWLQTVNSRPSGLWMEWQDILSRGQWRKVLGADPYEFMVVGRQSILGSFPSPEAVLTMSAEADLYPLNAPELAGRIEGAIGEGSLFHQTHGYDAQGVGLEAAILPDGWIHRVHRVQSVAMNDRVAYCLDDEQRRKLRATIRRWARAIDHSGHEFPGVRAGKTFLARGQQSRECLCE
jgi:hypothetical protein